MTSPDVARMNFLTFVTVSVATMAGVVMALMLLGAFVRDDDSIPAPIGLLVTPMPAIAAASAFLFVTRFETGRKWLGALAVFFGALAGTVMLVGLGSFGLVFAAVAAGGFGVLARRLLDQPARG